MLHPLGVGKAFLPPALSTLERNWPLGIDSLQGCGPWEGEQEPNQNVFLEDARGRCLPGTPNPAVCELLTPTAGSSHLEVGERRPDDLSAPSRARCQSTTAATSMRFSGKGSEDALLGSRSHGDGDGLEVFFPVSQHWELICRSQGMSMSVCEHGKDLRLMTLCLFFDLQVWLC